MYTVKVSEGVQERGVSKHKYTYPLDTSRNQTRRHQPSYPESLTYNLLQITGKTSQISAKHPTKTPNYKKHQKTTYRSSIGGVWELYGSYSGGKAKQAGFQAYLPLADKYSEEADFL